METKSEVQKFILGPLASAYGYFPDFAFRTVLFDGLAYFTFYRHMPFYIGIHFHRYFNEIQTIFKQNGKYGCFMELCTEKARSILQER